MLALLAALLVAAWPAEVLAARRPRVRLTLLPFSCTLRCVQVPRPHPSECNAVTCRSKPPRLAEHYQGWRCIDSLSFFGGRTTAEAFRGHQTGVGVYHIGAAAARACTPRPPSSLPSAAGDCGAGGQDQHSRH